MAWIRSRLISLLTVLGIGFVLLLSLALSTAITVVGKYLGELLPLPAYVFHVANFVVSFGVILVLFSMIYKLLPDVEIAWKDVWSGAAITSLLFVIGNYLITLYLSWSAMGSAYGAAGSLIVILVWVYYSAQVVFFGAEFTRAYADRYGSRIKPAEGAMAMTEQERTQQGLSSSREQHPRTEGSSEDRVA